MLYIMKSMLRQHKKWSLNETRFSGTALIISFYPNDAFSCLSIIISTVTREKYYSNTLHPYKKYSVKTKYEYAR